MSSRGGWCRLAVLVFLASALLIGLIPQVLSQPPAPTLVSPENNENINDNTPFMDWNPATGADNYDLQIDNDPNYSSPEVNVTDILADNYQVTTELAEALYYWHVRGENAGGLGPWSDNWVFRVDITAPSAPSLVWPADGENINDNTPTLDWSTVSDPSTPVLYRCYVDNDSDFSSVDHNSGWISSIDYTTPELAEDLWYWKVGAKDNAGNIGDNSASQSFRVNTTKPSTPSNTSPADRENTNDNTPLLDWSDSTDLSTPITYNLYLDNDLDFSSVDYTQTGLSSSQYQFTSELDEKLWYWRVCAVDNAGNVGDNSTVTSFRVDVTKPSAPTLVSPADGENTNDNTPTLDWNSVSDLSAPVLYRCYVDNDSDFSSVDHDSDWTSATQYTTPELAEGLWYWKVGAKDNAGNVGDNSASRSFRVDITKPSTPSNTSPADGENTNDNTPLLDWSDSTDLSTPITYNLYVDNDSDFSSVDYTQTGLTSSQYQFTSELAEKIWYWRACAVDNAGDISDNSTATWFRVDVTEPYAPALVWPADEENTNDKTPNLDWDTISDASLPVLYRVHVSDNSQLPYDNVDSGWISDDNYITSELAEGVWYWRVQAKDNAGNIGENSTTWWFRVDQTPPGKPTLVSPDNDSTVSTYTPTFEWSNVSDPSGVSYELVVDNESSFIAPCVYHTTGIQDNQHTSEDELESDNYYWRVKVVDGAGNEGEWADWFILKVPLPPAPSLVAPENESYLSDNTVDLKWTEVSMAEEYQVLVDNDSAFTSPEINILTSDNTHATSPLTDGRYYWKAQSRTHEWGDNDWPYRRPITISGSYPENYQIKILIQYDSGMQSDYRDLRFLENESSGELSYWIENYTADNVTVWVRREENSPSDDTIYVYYGNPNAISRSDGEATFMFYDDFQEHAIGDNPYDGSLDDWTADSGDNWQVAGSGSERYLWNGGQDYKAILAGDSTWTDYVFSADLRRGSADVDCPGLLVRRYAEAGSYDAVYFGFDDVTVAGESDITAYQHPAGGSWSILAYEPLDPGTTWHRLAEKVIENIVYCYYEDNLQFGGGLGLDAGITQGQIGFWSSEQTYYDNIIVRKYAEPEPTTSVGGEEVLNLSNWSDVWTFVVDTAPPVAPSLISPTDGDNINDNTPLFDWSSVPENSLPVTYDLWVDNDSDFSSPELIKLDLTNNNYQVQDAKSLPDTIYYWRVRATDNAGNVGDNSSTWTIGIDTVAPAAPIGLSASPSGWTNTNSFSVSWTNPSDLSGIAGAYCKLDSVPISPTDGIYVAGTGITSISGISVSSDGSHPIYVWLRDGAGNVGENNRSSTSLNLDTSAPGAPSLVSPANGTVTNDNTPTFDWEMVSGAVSFTLQYASDNEFTQDVVTVSVSWSSYNPTTGLTDGTWYWHVRAIDAAGNLSSWSSSWSFNIDTVAPSAPVLSDLSDEIYVQTLVVSGTAEVNSTVKVYMNGNLAGEGTASAGGSFSVLASLGEGSNIIKARAVDPAGNIGPESSTQMVVYTVTTAPSETVNNIEAGETATFNFTEYELIVTEITLMVKNTVFSPGIIVENVALPPGVSPPAGVIYGYLQISTNIENEDIESVEIRFRISRSWIQQNDIDLNTIKLYRYRDGEWQVLPTIQIGGDAFYIHFSAQITGLSLFVVAGEQVPPFNWILYAGAMLVIAIVCLLAYDIVKRKRA